jgi:hypothetical protein
MRAAADRMAGHPERARIASAITPMPFVQMMATPVRMSSDEYAPRRERRLGIHERAPDSPESGRAFTCATKG